MTCGGELEIIDRLQDRIVSLEKDVGRLQKLLIEERAQLRRISEISGITFRCGFWDLIKLIDPTGKQFIVKNCIFLEMNEEESRSDVEEKMEYYIVLGNNQSESEKIEINKKTYEFLFDVHINKNPNKKLLLGTIKKGLPDMSDLE